MNVILIRAPCSFGTTRTPTQIQNSKVNVSKSLVRFDSRQIIFSENVNGDFEKPATLLSLDKRLFKNQNPFWLMAFRHSHVVRIWLLKQIEESFASFFKK